MHVVDGYDGCGHRVCDHGSSQAVGVGVGVGMVSKKRAADGGKEGQGEGYQVECRRGGEGAVEEGAFELRSIMGKNE